MSNQCKIFISSAYDSDLRSLRLDLAEELKGIGHIPLLFEENFGYWGNDTMQKCIEMVSESDMVILIISHKSGSFTEKDPNVTATYVEYHTALKEGKLIIPFVKSDIVELYRKNIKPVIEQEIKRFTNKRGFEPDYTFSIMQNVKEYVQEYQSHLISEFEQTNDFIWSFLYDIDQKSAWMYSIELTRSVDAIRSIKEYLSEFVKLGVGYIPLKEQISQNANNARIFSDYVEFTKIALETIRRGKIDANLFLSKMIGKFEGGKVYTKSPYVQQELGLLEDCNGITLYENKEDKMICIAYSGATTPKGEYNLCDDSSFVVDTFKQESENEILYYQQKKRQVYMTIKIGSHVICFHYKLNGEWTETKVRAYENQIFSVILDVKARLFYNFVYKVIGGL